MLFLFSITNLAYVLEINIFRKLKYPTHLENNSPSKKIPSIIWVTMTLNLCFYYQLCVKWACIHVYRLEINLDILGKLIQVSLNVWGCLTPNEMHIELVSLIIWLNDYSLTNTSPAPPPEVYWCVTRRGKGGGGRSPLRFFK